MPVNQEDIIIKNTLFIAEKNNNLHIKCCKDAELLLDDLHKTITVIRELEKDVNIIKTIEILKLYAEGKFNIQEIAEYLKLSSETVKVIVDHYDKEVLNG